MVTAHTARPFQDKEFDTFTTAAGSFDIYFLGHGSLAIALGDFVTYIDPVSDQGNFTHYPKADLILVTHEHADHLDRSVIKTLSKPGTRLILSKPAKEKLGFGEALGTSEATVVALPQWAVEMTIKAVPAYNISEGRTHFHPKERGDNGYVLSFAGLSLYVAGDTEDIPEMDGLGHIDIAFLPMNQPYTMLPEQAASAARRIRPKILYPYHFGNTDTAKLLSLLEKDKEIEIKIRKLN